MQRRSSAPASSLQRGYLLSIPAPPCGPEVTTEFHSYSRGMTKCPAALRSAPESVLGDATLPSTL